MARLELLNTDAHADLRVRPAVAASPQFVQIMVSEFASAAACCPILLAKSPETGRFYAGAMFGFHPGENLVEDDPGAARAFEPLDVVRQGFFISGEEIAIDPANARFSHSEGEPLFIDGEPGEVLRRVQRALGQLNIGVEATDRFIGSLLDLRLIEPIDVSLRFDDGENVRLAGLYTVSLDSLGELDDADVLTLFRSGYLQLAYCMTASLRQIPVLAHRRNERLAENSSG